MESNIPIPQAASAVSAATMPLAGAMPPMPEKKDYTILVIVGAVALTLFILSNIGLHVANSSTINNLKKETDKTE